MPKRKSKAKDITARSISLVDSKGKTRIFMGVHDSGYSSICLFGERDRSIEISADHEGGVYISLRDDIGKAAIGIGIRADDQVGISLLDHRSGSHIQLGSEGKGQPPHVSLYHRGKVHWTTRKRRQNKSAQ